MNEWLWLIVGITLDCWLTREWHSIKVFFRDVDHQVYLSVVALLALGMFAVFGSLASIFFVELEWLLFPSLLCSGLYISILFLIFKPWKRKCWK